MDVEVEAEVVEEEEEAEEKEEEEGGGGGGGEELIKSNNPHLASGEQAMHDPSQGWEEKGRAWGRIEPGRGRYVGPHF